MKSLVAFFFAWLAWAFCSYCVQWDSFEDWLKRDGRFLAICSGPIALIAIIFASILDREEPK